MSYVTVRNDARLKKLLQEIFTDEFMQQHTNFENFTYFCYSSAVITNWEADPMVYDEDLLNRFVQESTEFDTFDNMVRTATDARFGQKTRKDE
ncbi:MAG: hypothetical protein IJO41_04245 [Oscillospiraceae bacterium]|nr:hypothetical protein [Oscillospiraceae bacterium]MBQ9837185.1 hypothetical protein [Oscillospiraceae bacterium]